MAIGEVIPDGDVTFRWSVYRDNPDSGTPGGWDVDDELVYQADPVTPVLDPAVLEALFYYPSSEDHVAGSFTYAPPYPTEPGVATFGTGQYFIRLEVQDTAGLEYLTKESSLIDVTSGEETPVEAVLTPDVNNAYVRGSEVSFDASYVGDVANPNYSWVVFKDGVALPGTGTGANVSFVPTSAGNYSINLTLKDGTTTVDTLTFTDILVANSRVLGGVLSIGAATGGSNVFITAASGGVNVTLDGVTTTYTGLAGINLYGQAGSDLITVTGNISTPLVIDAGAGNDTILIGPAVTSKVIALGGDGNDIIVGGSGNNVLVGGNGVDILTGGGARDILIGGDGSDILLGNSQDDILVAGSTDYDNNVAALDLILAQWLLPLNFAQRVNGLKASYLNNSTVHDDGDIDILLGVGGTDWFLINRTGTGVKDITLDANSTEINNRLDL